MNGMRLHYYSDVERFGFQRAVVIFVSRVPLLEQLQLMAFEIGLGSTPPANHGLFLVSYYPTAGAFLPIFSR